MASSAVRPTLLFTHGGGLCKEAWEPIVRRLHESSLLKRAPTATQAIDFPYHGSKRDNSVQPRVFTAGPRSRRAVHPANAYVSITTQEVTDFAREFKKRQPKAPLIGIGHSMGAVALWLTEINNPGTFDGLILFEPMYSLTKPENSYLIDMLVAATLRRETQWPSREAALAHLTQFKNFKTWDKESLDAYLKGALVEEQDGSITLACDPQIEAAIHCGYPFWISAEESARPKCRVSFHGGDVSRFFAVEEFEAMRAQSPHVYKMGSVMPNCSHAMVMENPELSAQKILEDLAELPVYAQRQHPPSSANDSVPPYKNRDLGESRAAAIEDARFGKGISSETNSTRSGRALSYMDCLSEVNVYLSHAPVSDDEPVLLFAWSRESLELFIHAANDKRRQRRRHKVPDWLTQIVGSITLQSLIGDVMNHLAQTAEGRFGNVCLAPNSKAQLSDILVRLAEFEAEPFVQRCMRDVPAGEVIVTVATLRDRQAAATSARSIPRRPQSHRLFFA